MNEKAERIEATLVLVDDEPDILEILEARFTDLVDKLVSFTDPRKALEFIRTNPVDVMLLDLKMPVLDGLSLFRESKKVQPGVVGIFLTGFGDKASVQEALKMGAFDFVDKPFNDKVLLNSVTHALERAQNDRMMAEILELFVKANTELDPKKFDQLSLGERRKTLKAALGVARLQIQNLRAKKN